MSWHYLQAQEGAFWAESSLDGAPSALLRLMPTVDRPSCSGRKTDSLNPSLSGTTLQRSTGNRGEEQWILSPGAFPVKTSVQQEREQESTAAEADSGAKWPESLAKFDPVTSSWRTRQCLLFEDSTECLETLPRWGTVLDGELWALDMPEHLIEGTESGLWPTPTARDHKDGTAKSCQNVPENCLLGRAVHTRWPPPTASRGGMEPDGKTGRKLTTEVGGQLNPPWVEWLMGWPIGWTDLKPLGMDKYRRWLNSHGGY
jgi:hypothetical protein